MWLCSTHAFVHGLNMWLTRYTFRCQVCANCWKRGIFPTALGWQRFTEASPVYCHYCKYNLSGLKWLANSFSTESSPFTVHTPFGEMLILGLFNGYTASSPNPVPFADRYMKISTSVLEFGWNISDLMFAYIWSGKSSFISIEWCCFVTFFPSTILFSKLNAPLISTL